MSKKSFFLTALIFVSGIISSSEGTTPQISGVSGTVSQGNTITISGSYMVDEDTTNWDSFFSDNSDASGFEGTSPSADGYSGVGPTGGTYVTNVQLLGSQSIRFHVQGASSNCPVGNLMDYNAFAPQDTYSGERYYRLYARWNTADDSWPTSHIKMFYTLNGGSNIYFQPSAGSVRPTHMCVTYGGASHYYAIPSGQLENDRWYAMEIRIKGTSPYAIQAWVDGTQIMNETPNSASSYVYLLFGIVNCCGTTSNFDLDHWMDGLAVSTSRIYPAAIVEIGDDSNYSTATKLHQAPLFLSDGSTQVKVDLTDLGSGPYYLWVTNNKQERSSSYQLQTDLATNPSPANSATNVDVDANLSWTAGSGATSHDVYFGTDSTPDSGELQGNQTAATFEPGTMSNSTTYYWRIDEVDSGGTTTGNVWSFTTESGASPPGQATNPSPANSATDVSINADLSWTAGSGTTSHDVYFGTSSPGTFQGNQTAATFEPGTMANDTTYYWRIDEINAGGTTTGNVWNFTTESGASPPGQATNPSPANSATDVSINADLSWTTGSGTTSHDVYFGTSSPGTFQGNQTAATFEPGTMANDTTYYWRIDEINAGGTTTGNVWSFTTIVAAPSQATNPSPADSATDVAVSADLSWTAGSGSTSSDVYFGTTSPGTFQGNQTATTFDPGTMDNGATYYWRIDELNAGGTTTGTVWSFTTIVAVPGQASSPSPADSATDVSINADLSWTAGAGSTSSDVYFGTTSPGTFQGNQTATTFDPGTMANDTTYYWRIDELNAVGTTTGTVWNFTTIVSTGDEIIGWWALDDGTGTTAADSTAYGNDGTLVGSPAWTNDAERGWCLDFSGDDNYVTIPNESFFDIIGNITVMAWMKDDYTDWRNISTIIAKGIDSSGGFALQKARRDNAMSFYVDVSGMPWYGIQAGAGIFDNQWHHVAGVYDGSNAYIYIDGGLDSNSVACSGAMATNDWDVYIGENSESLDGGSNGREWDGLLSDVRVYNYALTQSEVNDIYTGGPTPPGQASSPSPADSATDVSINADLSWTVGSGATSHDVYFGTSSPGSFQGNQTATTFDTGTMSNNTTYYWRIDEVNSAGTTTGSVWNFTTIVGAPAQASSPNPANSATDVAVNADLSWTAGSGATSHDVYFGTSSPGAFQGNQTATTFDTGTMSNDTTYYWRIDEVNAAGTTTGTVWSFTTIVAAPGQASNPSPSNTATGVSITADLSWSAGSSATSRDVYFGTSSPGTSQGNQTATTFDTGTMSNNTTYYWRIDEVNAAGTTTGTVWSFTTIVAAPGQASSPSPANSATGVSITADLSWTAGSGATSRDVYFGTSSPGTSQGNQTATTFDTGTMSNNTTYYWRIDEVNAGGTTTGTVWSFTTIVAAPGAASSPNPADSATAIAVDADLSWTAGSGATSHDVYFGTSSPGSFQGNQTAATFDTGSMDNDTTYYWRIDEVNAATTTTGTVWSFTTIVSGQPVTVEFGDAQDTNYPGTVEDTFTNGEENYSTNVLLSVYTWPADTIANTTIIKWDLTDISTDATVTDATLYLYQTDSGGDTSYDVPVHKIVNVNPVISACTWNTYDGTNSWTGGSDGGQGDTAVAEDTQSLNLTNDEYKTWSVTNMVADWVSTPSSNYGMLLNSDDVASVDSFRYFVSTEDSNTPYRPKLIVTYIAGSPGQATNPDPNDTAADVSTSATLSWTAGSAATSHDVYFGTSSPGAFQGNQTETTFDPGTLSYDITYYWRIDEINAAGTTIGNVWTFTTEAAPQPPGQATNPSPADSATNVDVDADLSWTAGTGSTSSDVYFGTSSPGSFQGNQTATTFEPGTMSNDTTYYWRIDEINTGGTTTGTVWSFTTIVAAPGAASSPSPADSATGVSTTADLSWTAGSGSTSSDVYFGTTSPGTFQGNQTATTFEPGTMSNDTNYYWRIDEINAGGTTTGTVWSFTTIVAAPGAASNPSPANSATDVNVTTDLSWTAGSGSTSSDVYFGTTSPGTSQGNQTATTFDTGTMDANTTYYWRIDEVNAGGTTTGNVWSFTTIVSAGDEIIGWWALDDGTGSTAADSTAYGNDGTLVGSPAWTNDAERSWCLDFSGDDNYVTIPNESFFDIIGDITLMAWMKDDYTDWRNLSTIIAKGMDSSGGWALQKARRTNAMSFYVDVSGMPWDGIKAGVGIFDNQWHHVAGVYDGSNAYIYIDGGLDSNSIACSGTMATNNWDVYIGENSQSLDGGSNGREWDGLLSDVRVYNYALTQSEVNDIYTGGPTPPGQASNPGPSNSATDVSITADLSWTASSGATSHDVYFGTTSPGTSQGNQTATTFDTGTMSNDTTYYWRIDEVNATGTTTGNVWSFTTVAASSDVEIIGSWLSGTTHTEETGTNRALIFTAHVEDNDTDMNVTSVTYGGQSMTKVVEQNVGTGYHAYVVAYVLDEDGIDAASSSSFVVTWAQTPSRSPGFSSVFLQNVNQTTPTAATDGNGTESSSTLATDALSTNDGDMVFVAGACGNSGTYSVNNSFTEGIEIDIASADAVAGYKAATGASETPSITHSNVNRQVVIGFVVQAE